VAVEAGSRGNSEPHIINENYIRFNLGFTFNDKWFLRRQIE
jgi:hypothetical protein